jgi:hypothetical protein
MLAASEGHTETVQVLHQLGALLDTRDEVKINLELIE